MKCLMLHSRARKTPEIHTDHSCKNAVWEMINCGQSERLVRVVFDMIEDIVKPHQWCYGVCMFLVTSSGAAQDGY